MGEKEEPLAMTVHLLANSGHGALLQQTLDQLLAGICPEVHLFQVSERVSPMKSYEKSHAKHSRFPGMSVLLFLHESFGEERIFHVLNSLQHSPWQYYPTQNTQGRLCPSFLANEEFYSLDNQMPVWGVRQVHCGTEILRVTLYCSFDNYEDAIRLYEMILQREATLQKSSFCFFVLYSTATLSLQLSLKQLPLGMSVDPKESSVLQFKVQEIGQLVPLLPNPCMPISSTRWQTQDYDGNRILLQVQTNPGLSVRNGELSSLNGTPGTDMLPQDSRLVPVSAKRTLELRSRRSRVRSFRTGSQARLEPSGSVTSEGSSGTSWKRPSWSPTAGSAATGTQLHLPSGCFDSGVRVEIPNHRNCFQKPEAEMNVDTGLPMVASEPRQSSLSRLPRDMQTSQPSSSLPAASLVAAASKTNRVFEERVISLPLAGQKDLGKRRINSKYPLHQPDQEEEKEGEEFFI